MDYDQILTEIKNKKFVPVYFLEGEEPYFIDRISDYILKNSLNETERDFNQTILYGKELSLDTIFTAAKRFPMMAEKQIVLIREAQNIKNIEDLAPYVEKPLKSTILIINYKYKTIDKRKKLYKAILKNGVHFESKSLYENQVPGWITKLLKSSNYGIEPHAAQLIADYVGSDLQLIVNNLEKLTITLAPGTTIKAEDIEKNIGISKEFNSFEFHAAIGKKDILKSNRILNYFIDNNKEHPLPAVIGALVNFFRKLLLFHSIGNKSNSAEVARLLGIHPFFLNDYVTAANNYNLEKVVNIISIMRETDLRSRGARGGNTENGELLRELVYKILH